MTCNSYLTPDPGDFGYTTYTSDGSTTDYNVGFSFPEQSAITSGNTSDYVKAYKNGDETPYQFINTTQIRFTGTLTNGDILEIKRESGLSATAIDWTNGTDTSGENIQRMNEQHQYLLQELWMKIKGLGCQVSAALEGSSATVREYNFTGNGSTRTFTLTSESNLLDAQVLVFVNGTRQLTTAYDIAGNPSIVTFNSAPSNGAAVSCVVLDATLVAYTVADGSITNAKLATGAVTYSKIDLSAHGTNNQAFMKRSGTWQGSTIVPGDISGFDAQVVTNRLSAMAVPNAAVSMNSQKITNLATGTASGDGVNKSQMDTAISTAVSAINVSGLRFNSGSVSFASSTATTVTVGFDWDWIELVVVSASNLDGTGIFTDPCYYARPSIIRLASDGSSEVTLTFGNHVQTSVQFGTFLFQKVTNGFTVRSSVGATSQTIVLRYICGKNFTG